MLIFYIIARTFVTHTSASWRWCYYVLIMLSGISLILQFFCYFPPTFKQLNQGRTKMQMIKALDYGGIVLFSASLACVLLGISWGGQKYRIPLSYPRCLYHTYKDIAWKSGNVIGTIVGGAVGLAVFFVYGITNPFLLWPFS
jgi:hypothetical protein